MPPLAPFLEKSPPAERRTARAARGGWENSATGSDGGNFRSKSKANRRIALAAYRRGAVALFPRSFVARRRLRRRIEQGMRNNFHWILRKSKCLLRFVKITLFSSGEKAI